MDDFFDEIGSAMLLFLLLTILTKGESDAKEEKLVDRLEVNIPKPVLQQEAICYVNKSRNRKRLKPKIVYF